VASDLNNWTIDSGATTNMSPYKGDFASMYKVDKVVEVADGTELSCRRAGKVPVHMVSNEACDMDVDLEDVLYVPALTQRLLSVDCMARHGHPVTFHAGFVTIKFGGNQAYKVTIPVDVHYLHNAFPARDKGSQPEPLLRIPSTVGHKQMAH